MHHFIGLAQFRSGPLAKVSGILFVNCILLLLLDMCESIQIFVLTLYAIVISEKSNKFTKTLQNNIVFRKEEGHDEYVPVKDCSRETG